MSEAERTEFDALKLRARRADATDIVTAKLSEAKLPEPAAKIVLAHFAEAECADAAAFGADVDAEVKLVKESFEGYKPQGIVRGVTREAQAPEKKGAVNVLSVMSEAISGKPADKGE